MNPSVGIPKKIAAQLCAQLEAKLIRPLGVGAFKHVFLINQHGNNLALKIAPVSPTLKARFERETFALRDCHHEAIATLIYAGAYVDRGNEYWITVEEFLPGGTLAEKLTQGTLSVEQTRYIGVTLADTLKHLHQRNLVHRDIKPANILFRNENYPVLTDFGIVRVLSEPSLTHDFMAQGPGTPLYAAPEQLLNDKASIDWRTDQFCLALVLVECSLGYPAFGPNGVGQREAVFSVANRAAIPEKTKADLSQLGLSCLIKALQTWPVQRYRWPDDFAQALLEEK